MTPPGPTGFLGTEHSYQQLQADPRTGLKKFEASPGILRHYQSFAIGDVQVIFTARDAELGVSQREINEMARTFRERLIRALGNSYAVLDSPARGKAIIRVALVDVTPNRLLGSLTPGILMPKVGAGGAAMEAEIIDSVSGRRLVAVMDQRMREPTGYFQGWKKWSSTEEAFDGWANILKQSTSRRG